MKVVFLSLPRALNVKMKMYEMIVFKKEKEEEEDQRRKRLVESWS